MDGIYANDMPVYSQEMPLHRFHDVQMLLTILIQLLLSHRDWFEGLLPSVIGKCVVDKWIVQKVIKKEEGPKICFYWLHSIFSLTSVAPTYLLVAQVQLDKPNCPRPRWQHNDKYCDLITPYLVNKSLVVTKHPTVLHMRCSFLVRVGKGSIFHQWLSKKGVSYIITLTRVYILSDILLHCCGQKVYNSVISFLPW